MPKPVLPKAERAIIAAHEAGMHDRKPTPATCRSCAMDAEATRVFAPLLTLAAPKPRGRPLTAGSPPPPAKVKRTRQVLPGGVTVDVPVEQAPIPVHIPDVLDLSIPDDALAMTVIEPASPAVTFESREAWMLAAVEAMRPWIAEVGAPVGPVRISFGWPGGRGNKQNVRGQCWMPEAVKDAVPGIFVSPAMESEDVVTILGIILHEMNHAAGHFGHVGAFAKTAAALGFVKPWTSSEGKVEALTARLAHLASILGPLDHASINGGHGLKGTGPAAPPVQSTRMLKVWCAEDGYTLRATAKWLNVAIPSCPLCDAEMQVERK